jgi:hypothetical protein
MTYILSYDVRYILRYNVRQAPPVLDRGSGSCFHFLKTCEGAGVTRSQCEWDRVRMKIRT